MLTKISTIFKKYILEIIVFIVGAVVMVLELVGSRILAPCLGTSIFVWASLIGIILGSLSLGYWRGGKMADKNPNYKTFSIIIFAAAVFIGLDTAIKSLILNFIYNTIKDIRIGSITATLLLFAPPNILLGIITPYAVKLKMKDLNNSGSTVGNLYAISTIGSITGTFMAGFFLILYFSNTQLLLILSLVLIIASLAVSASSISKTKTVFLFFLVLGFAATNFMDAANRKNGFIDIDTEYNKVWILNGVDSETKKPARFLILNKESNSAMFLDDDGLVFNYTKFYRLAEHFKPNFKNSLMLGGGAYSYPKYYLKKFPRADMDVVEIDPALTKLSKQYFNLTDNPRLKIYHDDARIFINGTKNKYDVVLGDAFKSLYSIPYQLTTIEATQKIYNLLNEDGVILINIISAIEGENGQFLRAEYATYKSIFPQVYVFPVDDCRDGLKVQNIILAALKSKQKPSFENANPELNEYLKHLWTKEIKTDIPALADEYAPVDQYMMKMIKNNVYTN